MSKEQALMWGPEVVETPHIDSLAENGVICTSFYASTPVCSPSRAALISGRYPQHTAVVTNNIPLSDDIVTFAEILRREGYATGFIGKWHLDGSGKPQWAPKRKFGFDDNRYMYNRGHWKQFEDTPNGPQVKALDKKGNPSYSAAGADEQSFATDFLMRKAHDFVETNKSKPFCLMVSIPDPHGPDSVRPPYDTMYKGKKFDLPRTFSTKPNERTTPDWGAADARFQDMANYYGMVKCIDDALGKLLAKLKTDGLEKRTIIVFTSDHGDLRGEHNRQNKGVPYEGSARIPFLLKYPDKITKKTVIDQALSSVDFLPTVLNLMNVKTAGKEQGRDATPLFLGKNTEWNDIAFMRGTGPKPNWVSAVTDQYKLVVSPYDIPWLFDLKRDPDELQNFFTDPGHRETARQLATEIKRYQSEIGDISLEVPTVQKDLEWAINGKEKYTPPARKKKPQPNPLRDKKK
jgi:arylsulfatase A-like enzyme